MCCISDAMIHAFSKHDSSIYIHNSFSIWMSSVIFAKEIDVSILDLKTEHEISYVCIL